jgi:hypothetical protein
MSRPVCDELIRGHCNPRLSAADPDRVWLSTFLLEANALEGCAALRGEASWSSLPTPERLQQLEPPALQLNLRKLAAAGTLPRGVAAGQLQPAPVARGQRKRARAAADSEGGAVPEVVRVEEGTLVMDYFRSWDYDKSGMMVWYWGWVQSVEGCGTGEERVVVHWEDANEGDKPIEIMDMDDAR